jgi:hypothetical protein
MSDELHVFEVRVDFRYELEEVRTQFMGRAKRELGGFYPAKHGKATVTLLFVRNGTHVELSRKLAPISEKVTSIDNYWVSYAPRSAVALHSADPYVHWLRTAWEKA